MTRFLHTADWQIGKPFQSIQDASKREMLRQQRVDTIHSLQAVIVERKLSFVVVCGDLFDSFTPDKPTVSALCSAVGSLGVPVYAIPGNHDHAGPGCIWAQDFFQKEQKALAPNLHILLTPDPVVLDEAVLLPCPLCRRHESADPTAWLRTPPEAIPANRPQIVLAHGSTQGFSSSGEADLDTAANQMDLTQLAGGNYDYIALGDWHGYKKISPSAWYSGTPEQDRYSKGGSNLPGHVLVVEIQGHGETLHAEPVRTGKIGWHSPDVQTLNGDADLDALQQMLDALVANRTGKDLLKLTLQGALSFSGKDSLNERIESLRARLIDVRLEENVLVEPSDKELAALKDRDDPLIVAVALSLHEKTDSSVRQEAEAARAALRELHLQLNSL